MEDFKYRVWIGCLGCYNEGRSVGEWFDADNLPADESEWLDGLDSKPKPHDFGMTHEELWVMDHENSPVEGEYGVNDAQRYADWLGALDHQVTPQLEAYIKNIGEFDEETAEKFTESYRGEFDELADAYEELYPESSLPEWAQSSRWLILRNMADEFIQSGWWTEDAPMGRVHVFAP